MGRKASKGSPRNYFTKETDEYIVLYNNEVDPNKKAKIFTEHIYYPFYKLAENIVHTFKFYNIDVEQIEDLKLDIVTMLLQEKIAGFDPTKGFKAYSYFSSIVKRWLIAYCTSNYNRKKQRVPIDYYVDEEGKGDPTIIETDDVITLSTFIDKWVESVYASMDELFPKESDKQIADAVLTIFRTRKDLQIFKKKALYVYIREITDCSTLFLTKVVLVLKEDFYRKYNRLLKDGIIFDDTLSN